MSTHVETVQQLYVAYFNRPADVAGLNFWTGALANGVSSSVIAAEFAKSAEYKSLFEGKVAEQVIDIVYVNMFGRHAEKAALDFYGPLVQNGTITIDKVVTDIVSGAQGTDGDAYNNKVTAATAFTDELNTAGNEAERLAYASGNATVLNLAKAWLANVTDEASLTTALAGVAAAADSLVTGSTIGQTFTLTVGVDTFVGGAGNDTINGSYDAINDLHTLSGLDNVDGGAGTDTLTLTDAEAGGGNIDLSLATIKNIEVLNLSSVGALANAAVNVKGFTGLTDANIAVKQGALVTVTAATTTEVDVSNDHAITIVGGGGDVSATTSAAQAILIGNVAGGSANANKIVTATTSGGTTVDITDNSGTSGAVGATLTTVSVADAAGAITLTGKAITNVSLAGVVAAATLTNAVAHTLNLTIDDVGTAAEIIDDTATAINLTVASDSDLIVDAGKAATLTVTADGDLTLVEAGSDYAALTKVTVTGEGVVTADLDTAAELVTVDASGAAGGVEVTIKGTNSAAGGAAAQSVTGGAGDDTVTITGTLGTGSTLSLGAGSDSVNIAGAGVITGAAVVDAGAGEDMLALKIVGGANVGAFKNFEQFDVAGITANFDQAVLNTKNTVTGFVGTAAVGADVTLQNLGAGVGFTVLGDMNQGAGTIVTLNQATAGALTIATDVDGAKGDGIIAIDAEFASANAKSLTVNFGNDNVDEVANTAGIKFTNTVATAVTIDSNGSNVTNTFTLADGVNKVAAVTVTGDQALVLTNTGTALASVDASGQTAGGITFTLSQMTSTGTIKLGGGDDILTGAAIDTSAVTSSTVQTVDGLAKGSEEGLAAQDGFDVIKFAGAAQAADVTAAAGVDHSISNGLYTFIGAGAPNLAAAVAQINGDLAANATVVFEFAGSFYVYGQGALVANSDDLLVKLTGVTSVAGLDIAAATEVYVF